MDARMKPIVALVVYAVPAWALLAWQGAPLWAIAIAIPIAQLGGQVAARLERDRAVV